MNIFGKKKEEEEVDEEEKAAKEISEKKFKDLNPQNRRKRKEPPKPWGRSERMLVTITLTLTVVASGVLALGAREWKLPGLPKISLPDLDFNIFKEETIVVGGNPEEFNKNKNIMELFKAKTKNLSGVYSFYLVPLTGGNPYGVNENEKMQAASLIKLPILMALYKEAEEGKINLDSKYVLKDSDKTGGSGSIVGSPAGTVYTYRELAMYMGQQSDNTAATAATRILGEDKINLTISQLGMTNTSFEDNETSPKDIGILLEKLWRGDFISEDSRDEILDFLTDTIYEDHLKAGIPDVRVAHKYGRELHVVNDAGIVYADEPFVLIIMTKGIIEKEADNVFPELAKLLFDQEIGK